MLCAAPMRMAPVFAFAIRARSRPMTCSHDGVPQPHSGAALTQIATHGTSIQRCILDALSGAVHDAHRQLSFHATVTARFAQLTCMAQRGLRAIERDSSMSAATACMYLEVRLLAQRCTASRASCTRSIASQANVQNYA